MGLVDGVLAVDVPYAKEVPVAGIEKRNLVD